MTERRLGLLGGTFDPIHYGHLRSAEEVRELFALSTVVFMPCGVPPHKADKPVAAGEHRLEMVGRAIAGNPAFEASDMELRRPGPSYTVDTLRALRAERPDATLYLIMGWDAFRDIGTWKEAPALFPLCHTVVTGRPGWAETGPPALPVAVADLFRYDTQVDAFVHRGGTRLYLVDITLLDIASTGVREARRKGASIRYLVPPAVEEYIVRERLYTD